MPRQARLAVAGIPWHIIQRGHNRRACFFTDADYGYYLHHLGKNADKHGCSIHAYVLMTNHVHLLLTPEAAESASLMMKNVNQRYVQYINRTYDRSGTLWGGRFKSCLTETDQYALACYRYVELNPVRAKIVDHPKHYRWSSYAANADGWFNKLLSPHPVYLALGLNDPERRKRYRALVQSGLDDDTVTRIRSATNTNMVLGNERFEREIAAMLGRSIVQRKRGRPRKKGTYPLF